MPRTDFDRLFDQLESLTVGFGPVFRQTHSMSSNYPPHNIVKISPTEFLLELAVAGFKKSEIQLEFHQGQVTIKGEKGESTDSTYQHRGIANRSFTRSFSIAEYFEIDEASMEDGILSIKFIKNIPEEAKPKLISIS